MIDPITNNKIICANDSSEMICMAPDEGIAPAFLSYQLTVDN